MSTTLLARACGQSTNSFAPGTGRSCRAARKTWGLGEPSEPLGPRPESHLPVDSTIDSRAGYRGDLRFLPDDRREFREEFVENQGVL